MYVKKRRSAILCFAWIQLAYLSPVQSKGRLLPILRPNGATANLSSPVANLTWGQIPLEFTMSPDLSLPFPFPQEAAFINIVHALKEIAHGDFQGAMPAQDFRTAAYPEPVIILTSPSGSRTIERKYVVWGLYGALLYMYNARAFGVSHFTLLWNNEEVGGIGFGHPYGDGLDHRAIDDTTSPENTEWADDNSAVPEDEASAGAELASRATAAGEVNRATENLTDLASRLSVTFTYAGRNMDKAHMFMAIVWTLATAAIYPSNERIQHLWTPVDQESPCKFVASAVPRTTPPYLQYFWIVEAVAKTAAYLVATNTYRQLSVLMKVDEVVVGRALLFHRADERGMMRGVD
ncbi:MAG: hypothetical protein Q9208_003646 [Pyrenodesmia sp. 3 TL-2023]